jgi:hypothetical protein
VDDVEAGERMRPLAHLGPVDPDLVSGHGLALLAQDRDHVHRGARCERDAQQLRRPGAGIARRVVEHERVAAAHRRLELEAVVHQAQVRRLDAHRAPSWGRTGGRANGYFRAWC